MKQQKNGSGQEQQAEYIITETGMNLAIAALKKNKLYYTIEFVLSEIRKYDEDAIRRQAQEEGRERVLNTAITEFETRCRNVVESGMDPKMFQRAFDMADGMQEAIIYLKKLRDKEKKEGPA